MSVGTAPDSVTLTNQAYRGGECVLGSRTNMSAAPPCPLISQRNAKDPLRDWARVRQVQNLRGCQKALHNLDRQYLHATFLKNQDYCNPQYTKYQNIK